MELLPLIPLPCRAGPRRLLPFLAVFAAVIVIAAPSPSAAYVSCHRAIATRYAKFVQNRIRVLQKCEDQVLSDRRAGPCPDQWTTSQIAKLEAELVASIATSCGGEDRVCGTSDDEDLADIGWESGTCPEFEGACGGPVGHCGDVASCLACVGAAATDQAVALAYDQLTPAAPSEFQRCQASIGRSLARYFTAKLAALEACEDKVLHGALPGPCPDPLKAAPRIARAAAKVHQNICRTCGGFYQVCGLPDELTAAEIGFPTQCPAVTVPGGRSCGGSNDSLHAIADCVACVTDFKVDCVDAVSVPTLKPYPPECEATP